MNYTKIYQASPYMTHRFWNEIRDMFRSVSRHGFCTNANRPKTSVYEHLLHLVRQDSRNLESERNG